MSDENQQDSPPEPSNDGNGENDKSDQHKGFSTDITGDVGTAVLGDHAKVTIDKKVEHHHYYYNSTPINDIRSKQEKFNAGASDPDFTPDEKTKEAAKEMPISTDVWFYSLSDYDQCFVLAMATFYGGPIDLVARAVEQLYTPLLELEKERQKKQEQAPTEPVKRIPLTERLQRLHITSRRISGTERLYWQDTDTNNNSEFSTRLLLYIAREASFKFGAQEGQIFNQQLPKWVEDVNSDIAWRAARALGVSWWQNNTNEIGTTINRWAGSDRTFDWHRAAWSLDGAYKIDKMNYQDAADDVKKSPVLKKLRGWVIQARNKQHINLGSTAAIAYAFIGRSSPQVGMSGLDTLLELPKAELEQDYEDVATLQEIYDAVVFCYRDLAHSGRVREILQHLASYVKNACYNRVHLNGRAREERHRGDLQRELRLGAAFDILFWIAEASFPNAKDMRSVSYELTGTLPVKPSFGSKKGKDLLLEGILREDEKEWCNSIRTLLCAALVERNTKLAFLLLRRWAELVMRDQSKQPDDVRRSYVRFMRDLAIQVDTWCHHLQTMDFHAPNVINTFIRKLETWKLESRQSQVHGYVPIGLLAQEVLDELPFVDGGLVPSAQKQ